MTVKYFRFNLILLLICFLSVEMIGIADPHDGLEHPELEVENEVVRPVSYKLTKIPVPEKLPTQDVFEPTIEKKILEFISVFFPVSHSTYNFSSSGAKLARELSTIS